MNAVRRKVVKRKSSVEGRRLIKRLSVKRRSSAVRMTWRSTTITARSDAKGDYES